MAFNIWQFLIAAASILAASCINAESIQLQPTQGILIPAPLTDSFRVARSAYGGGGGGGSSYSAPSAQSYAAPPPAAPAYAPPAPPAVQSYSAPAPAPAPISIPAPPCPRNYIFSCQPSLQPVACSPPAAPAPPAPSAAHYGMQGAYSHFAPQYALPPTAYGVPVVKELY